MIVSAILAWSQSHDDVWVKILETDGTRQRDGPRKRWKEVVDKDVNDLHLKPTSSQ